MDIEIIREHCLSKAEVSEGFPFDETTLVFKVKNKIFCLVSLETPIRINLKCEPALLLDLRERYDFVLPGYHMNKKHWMTVDLSSQVKSKLIFEWIDNSYNLVVAGLPRKVREELDRRG